MGFGLGTFPVLGATAILCAGAAAALRLNHPAIQLVNFVAYVPSMLLLARAFRVAMERLPVLRDSRPEPPLAERARASAAADCL